ncbi:MAG: InlB B-repeat-containing protein, partial [Spirochaetales bacterium]|nr:InlB B-repeat-containing protein [Spirochaetales bacterium]
CTTDQTGSQSVTTETTNKPSGGNDNSNKITSLQAVIDSSDIKDGSEIDLSQYKDISDFNYNATINKSITIKNGNDLKGATLKVVTDGVVLSGIKQASVTTQSSLKISSSSLSSLSISEVSRGRGVSDNAKINPPTVETDSTTVASAVTVAIENAQIVAEKFTANEINLAGMNTQLTLKDNVSNISKITTDTVCQVVLEKGASDTIPNSTDKITVSGSGELTQIDMTVQEGFTLVALTPMSSIKTLLKKGDSIDFTNLAMLGTYVSTSKMKIFRANLTVDFTETFSKLEKNFTVTIGDDKKEIFKDGEPTDFDWAKLENCVAEIDSDFANKSHDYKQFKFNIAVIGADIEELPEFELKSIEVQTGSAKTKYIVGDILDLRRLLVLGNYEQGKYSYNGIITDYELDPPNGTLLTIAGTQNVTVTVGDKTETIEITVKEVKPEIKRYAIQFNNNGGEGTVANQDMTCDVSADLTANTFTRTGYTFQGWAETANGDVKYANQARVNNLSATNGTIVTLYAVWTANTYKVTLNNEGVTNIIDVTFDTIVPTITNLPTKTGFTFGGYWTQA